MKPQFILLAAICLASVWALPVPDEEVPIPTDLGVAKNELRGKNGQNNPPIEPAPASPPAPPPAATQPQVVKIESKSAATAAADVPAAAAAAPAATAAPDRAAHSVDQTVGTTAAAKERANAQLKLQVPDLETAPAIPQKNIITTTEQVNSVTSISAEPKPKQDRSGEPIETPKAVPIPAANVEVRKQIVEETKPAVLNTPAAGKSAVEPAVAVPKAAVALDKPEIAAEPKEKLVPAASEQKPVETKPEQSIQVIAPAAAAEKRELANVEVTTSAVTNQPEKPKSTATQQTISTTSVPLPLPSARDNNKEAELKATKTEEASQQPIVPDVVVAAASSPAAVPAAPEAKKIDAVDSSTAQAKQVAIAVNKASENPSESDESAGQKSDDQKNKSAESQESDESAESHENDSE